MWYSHRTNKGSSLRRKALMRRQLSLYKRLGALDTLCILRDFYSALAVKVLFIG